MDTNNSANDNNFEEERRPTRKASAAANRDVFIESGTDDDEPGTKRKHKKAGGWKRAKRQRRLTESSEDEKDMKSLTEKEQESSFLKHNDQDDLIKAKNEIHQKLMGNSAEMKPSPFIKLEPKVKKEIKEESDAGEEPEFDPEFHKPSEIAKKIEKKNAIADLVKQRKEKKENEIKKAEQVLDVDKIFGDGKENKSNGEDSSSSSSDSSDGEISDDDDAKNKTQIEYLNSIHQVNAIRLSRFKISKFCHAPFFEETIKGCFVRVSIGSNTNGEPVYRAVQVVGVIEDRKNYSFENIHTNKVLRLKHGSEERIFRLDVLSNKEITANEFVKWRESMEKARLPLPTEEFVKKKRESITAALNYQFTNEDVKKMVEQNRKFKNIPQAALKRELLQEKSAAQQCGNIEKVREIQLQLDKIEGGNQKQKELAESEEAKRIAAINKRNQEAQLKSLKEKAMRQHGMNAEDEEDPFTRKAARSRLVTGKPKHPF